MRLMRHNRIVQRGVLLGMANTNKSALTTSSPSRIVHAPQPFNGDSRSVFLSGSISEINRELWQRSFSNAFSDSAVTILDPYRPDWDASWKEDISFAPFKEQVEWELDMQEKSDIIALYFGPEAKAPISLLELGLFVRSKKAIVACPDGFWKKGNVQIVCARFGIELVDDLDALIQSVKVRLTSLDAPTGASE